jgi:photosystem II stability/assembly factor-like uncharacterized protein
MQFKEIHKYLSARVFLSTTIVLCSAVSSAQLKPTPGDARLKSLQEKNRKAAESPLKDISFRNIGPTIMSGRVDDLEVNPADPTEFYVAYATGGLWHTTNNGQSFTPIFDQETVVGIGDIAVNWQTRTIWVGTGEVNSSRSSYAGIGVFKSSDNGKSWEYLGLPESHHIGKITLHPSNPSIAWVAVLGHLYSPNKDRGVYKTIDGGKTWKQTLTIDENTGSVEMEINSQNPNEMYASTWHRIRKSWNFVEGGKTSGIYKSSDGGESWQLISGASSGFPQGDGVGRIGLAVYPKDPSVVYAVVDNYNLKPDTSKADTGRIVVKDLKNIDNKQLAAYSDPALERFIRMNGLNGQYSSAKNLREALNSQSVTTTDLYAYLYDDGAGPSANQIYGCEVYKSTDAGKTWKKTHQQPISIYNTFGYYFGKVFVSPVNSDKIVILGISANLSMDGGKTFTSMDKGNTHADWHALWINPNRDNHMIAGNDGGCNITYDAGKNWFKANSPAVGQFYAINVDNEKPYNVYGGLQDNGSWYGPSTNRESIDWTDDGQYGFKRLNGGDGMQVQIDPRDHNIVYSGSQFGAYMRINKLQPTPRFLRPPAGSLKDPRNRFNWQTPILLSRHNPDILYMAGNSLFRSMNKGDQFEKISGDLSNGKKTGDVPFGTLTTISESPFRFGLLYTGSDDGVINVTKDGGYCWSKLGLPDKKGMNGLPQGLYVSRVLASRHKESRVYVTLNGYRDDHFDAYVYCSDDYGITWKRLGLDLPLEAVNAIREDPKWANILYVATDGGVYASTNGGESFVQFTNGLPKGIPVHDLTIQERENEIILGTHGRSIYIGKLDLVQKMTTQENK